MGHFGFSYIGFIWLLMLAVPNIIWIRFQPQGYDGTNENIILSVFERAGQVLVTCSVLFFSDLHGGPLRPWSFWLLASLVLMGMYEFWWIRYFKSRRTLKDFYGSLWKIPVPGATLPVLAFLLLGIYGKVFWLVLSAVILGIGHVGIHLQHRKEIKNDNH